MGAKDTVLNDIEMAKLVTCPKMVERQAEISFLAGMKEVVEWVENHSGNLDGFRTEWQVFKKKRGL